ncbi:MAG: peptidoglycan-binding domain-containing protein [Deinococcota bacterium]
MKTHETRYTTSLEEQGIALLSTIELRDDLLRLQYTAVTKPLLALLQEVSDKMELVICFQSWSGQYPAATAMLIAQIGTDQALTIYFAPTLLRLRRLLPPNHPCITPSEDVLVMGYPQFPPQLQRWAREYVAVSKALGLSAPACPKPPYVSPAPWRPSDTVLGAKARLIAQGYFFGDMSEQISPQFVDALRRFQFDSCLDITGELDADTVECLNDYVP